MTCLTVVNDGEASFYVKPSQRCAHPGVPADGVPLIDQMVPPEHRPLRVPGNSVMTLADRESSVLAVEPSDC